MYVKKDRITIKFSTSVIPFVMYVPVTCMFGKIKMCEGDKNRYERLTTKVRRRIFSSQRIGVSFTTVCVYAASVHMILLCIVIALVVIVTSL